MVKCCKSVRSYACYLQTHHEVTFPYCCLYCPVTQESASVSIFCLLWVHSFLCAIGPLEPDEVCLPFIRTFYNPYIKFINLQRKAIIFKNS